MRATRLVACDGTHIGCGERLGTHRTGDAQNLDGAQVNQTPTEGGAEPQVDKCPPLVLPRGCECLVDLGTGGWPKRMVQPRDSGLYDPSCALWHGTTAANDANSPD